MAPDSGGPSEIGLRLTVVMLQLNIANPITSQQKKLEIDDDSKL